MAKTVQRAELSGNVWTVILSWPNRTAKLGQVLAQFIHTMGQRLFGQLLGQCVGPVLQVARRLL